MVLLRLIHQPFVEDHKLLLGLRFLVFSERLHLCHFLARLAHDLPCLQAVHILPLPVLSYFRAQEAHQADTQARHLSCISDKVIRNVREWSGVNGFRLPLNDLKVNPSLPAAAVLPSMSRLRSKAACEIGWEMCIAVSGLNDIRMAAVILLDGWMLETA